MAYFLAKTEPSCYSIEDLARERSTPWDGVRSPQAVTAIKAMSPGDIVLIYHSGGESRIVGVARVTSPPRPDPEDSKSWMVDVDFVNRLEAPVSLRQVKASGQFDDSALVRQGRLSTMPLPESFIAWLRAEHGAAIP